MAHPVTLAGINHVTLTVTDLATSEAFYSRHLGFQTRADRGWRKIMHNGVVMLVINTPADKNAPVPEHDRFSENRVGLDHLSFSVGSLTELEAAAAYFDAEGVVRGEIHDLGDIYVMAFRDPDNIQLELTAPGGGNRGAEKK